MNTTAINRNDLDTTALPEQQQQQQQHQKQQTLLLRQQLQNTVFKSIHPTVIEDDENHARNAFYNNNNKNNDSEMCYDYTVAAFFHVIRSICLLFLNTYSSLGIFTLHLISYECIISILLSVGLTLYIHFSTIDSDSDFNGNTMNWVLLTFAVITPIGATIQMVFTRRENALLQISTLRSTMIQLYNSYTIWGWDYQPYTSSMESNSDDLLLQLRSYNDINGRTKSNIDWLEHSDLALREILYICDDLTR